VITCSNAALNSLIFCYGIIISIIIIVVIIIVVVVVVLIIKDKNTLKLLCSFKNFKSISHQKQP